VTWCGLTLELLSLGYVGTCDAPVSCDDGRTSGFQLSPLPEKERKKHHQRALTGRAICPRHGCRLRGMTLRTVRGQRLRRRAQLNLGACAHSRARMPEATAHNSVAAPSLPVVQQTQARAECTVRVDVPQGRLPRERLLVTVPPFAARAEEAALVTATQNSATIPPAQEVLNE